MLCKLSDIEFGILHALVINKKLHNDLWIRNVLRHPKMINEELNNLRNKKLISRKKKRNKPHLYRITKKGLILLLLKENRFGELYNRPDINKYLTKEKIKQNIK